jgi:hypothetical protein
MPAAAVASIAGVMAVQLPGEIFSIDKSEIISSTQPIFVINFICLVTAPT